MFKRTILIIILTAAIPNIIYPLFEIGTIVTEDERSLLPFPREFSLKITVPKKIIVRRSDGTLKYAIALKQERHIITTLVAFNKHTGRVRYKKTSYNELYLKPEWITNTHATTRWAYASDASEFLTSLGLEYSS